MRSLRCDHGENETHELGRRVLGLTQATRSISVAFGSSSLREENELSEEDLEWDRRDHGLIGPWGESPQAVDHRVGPCDRVPCG